MTRTLARRDFLKACKKIAVGQTIQSDAMLRGWDATGYQRVNTVLEQGQFSRRGGIVDVWPPADKLPFRLDFFGDEIESIRRFDPASQRTVEQMDGILITPAREVLVGQSNGTAGRVSLSSDTGVSEFDIPVLHPQPSSLMDFLPAKSLMLIDDLSVVESMVAEIEEQAVRFRKESVSEGTLSPDFPVPYLTWPELADEFSRLGALELGRSTAQGEDEDPWNALAACFTQDERFGGRLKPFNEYVARLVGENEPVIIVSRQRERLEELWKERGRGI